MREPDHTGTRHQCQVIHQLLCICSCSGLHRSTAALGSNRSSAPVSLEEAWPPSSALACTNSADARSHGHEFKRKLQPRRWYHACSGAARFGPCLEAQKSFLGTAITTDIGCQEACLGQLAKRFCLPMRFSNMPQHQLIYLAAPCFACSVEDNRVAAA